MPAQGMGHGSMAWRLCQCPLTAFSFGHQELAEHAGSTHTSRLTASKKVRSVSPLCTVYCRS